MQLIKRSQPFLYLFVFILFIFLLEGCPQKSKIRHTKLGDLEETAETAALPTPDALEAPTVPTEVPTEAPTPEPTQEAIAPTPVPVEEQELRVVKAGDTLWDISAEKDIYSNAFLWPLLYRSNKDKIMDPDLIYPKQELAIGKKYDKEEMGKAIGNAKKTPPYLPHRKPRKELPLSY